MYSEKYEQRTAIASAERAKDPALTDHELAALARSEEAKVRATVAERSETPLTSLLKLMDDQSPAVRAGVARNQRPDMPEEIFQTLAKDKSPEVIHALISNPAVPDSLIGKLARSRHKDIALAARKRLTSKGGASKVLGIVGLSSS